MSSLSPKPKNNKPYPWSQKKLNSFNPFPRHNLSVSGQATNGKLFLFGGISQNKTTNEVFVVEVNSLNVLPIYASGTVPQARSLHTQINVGPNVFVFGGKLTDGKLDDSIYVLDTDSKYVWSKPPITGNLPSGRYGHTSVLVGTTIYIFGGRNNERYLNDLISFDVKSFKLNKKKHKFIKFPLNKGNNNLLPAWNFITPKNSPPPIRSGHTSCVYDNKIYIFGGSVGEMYYNDTWYYDLQENAWTELSCTGFIPTPREFHDATIVNDIMYVFGGRTREGTELGDLCAFRISNFRWYKFPNLGPSPSPRYGLKMAVSHEKKVYIFGGESSQIPKPDEDGSIHILDTSKIKFPTGNQSAKAPEENVMQSPSLDASNINGTRLAKVSFQMPNENSENIIITGLSPPPRTISSPSSDTSSEIRPTKTVLQQIPEENSSELAELAEIERAIIIPSRTASLQSFSLSPPQSPSPSVEPRKISKGKEVDRSPITIISQPTISQPKVITSDIIMAQGSSSYPILNGKIFQPQRYSPTDSENSSYELQTMGSSEKSPTHQQRIPSPRNLHNKNYNNSVVDGVRSSSPLPMVLRPKQETNFRTKSLRDTLVRRESFEIQKTIPEESTPPNEISTSQTSPSQNSPNNNRANLQRGHRRTVSQEISISNPRVLSRRRISIDNYSRSTLQELSANYPPRGFPIRRASADNYRTNSQITEIPLRRTPTDNQRTISPITESSSKRILADNQRTVSELPSRRTPDDPKTINALASKKVVGNSPISISPTAGSPSIRISTNDQEVISPTTESHSGRTSIDDQRTLSSITESTYDQTTTSPITDSTTTSPITKSPLRQVFTDDQSESPSTRSSIDNQRTNSLVNNVNNNLNVESKVIPAVRPTNNSQKLSISPTMDNSEKIRNIQTILANARNNSSSSINNIVKRDSFDSVASTESNQSTNDRPRGIRPIRNDNRPNNSSPLFIRTDSHEFDRDNLIKLRQKLANSYSNGNFSDSSDNLSIASSRSEVVYNDNTSIQQQSQPQSSNSSISDLDENESENSVCEEDKKTSTSIDQMPKSDVTEDISNESNSKIGDEKSLIQELEKHRLDIEEFKQRETWFKAELDSARKSGFTPDLYDDTNNNDGNSVEEIEQMLMNETGDDDANTDQTKVVEAIVQMQQKILKAKAMIANQAQVVSQKISSSEKARSVAIQEASEFKAKLENLIKSSESKISSIESDKTKELEDKLIKVVSENKILEDQYSELCQSSNLETSDKIINEQIRIDLSRAEIAEKANERVLAQLAALKLRNNNVESQLEESNKQLETTNNELEHFRKEKSNNRSQINKLQSNLSHHQQIFEQVSIAVLAANERAEETEKLWKESRDHILKLEKEVLGLRIELDKKAKELDRTVTKVNDMERILGKVQKEGNVIRNMMQEGMVELLNFSWLDKFSNNSWENARIRKLEEELAQLKSMRDEELIMNEVPKEEETFL